MARKRATMIHVVRDPKTGRFIPAKGEQRRKGTVIVEIKRKAK